jgi:hypothetical protein
MKLCAASAIALRPLHVESKGGARERLAIGAMANAHGLRIDFRLECNVSAVTGAFDFHLLSIH